LTPYVFSILIFYLLQTIFCIFSLFINEVTNLNSILFDFLSFPANLFIINFENNTSNHQIYEEKNVALSCVNKIPENFLWQTLLTVIKKTFKIFDVELLSILFILSILFNNIKDIY